MIKETKNYIRIPVASRKPGDVIRTIDISKEQGIKALIAIRPNTKKNIVITYLFDSSKEWTAEKATFWVETNHEKSIKKDFRFGFVIKNIKGSQKGNFIEGFASTPDIDRDGEMIDPKSFELAIEEFMKNPVLLAQHNHERPIGRIVDYKISKEGFWIKAQVVDTETWDLIKNGVLKAFSWGGRVKGWMEKWFEEFKRMVRIVTQVELYEVSVVSVPANANALFSLSKSLKSVLNFAEDDETDDLINNLNKSMKKKTIKKEQKDKLEKDLEKEVKEKDEKDDEEKKDDEDKKDDDKEDEGKKDDEESKEDEESDDDNESEDEESEDEGDEDGEDEDEESNDKPAEDATKTKKQAVEVEVPKDTLKTIALQKAMAKGILAILGEVRDLTKKVKDLEAKQLKKVGLLAKKFDDMSEKDGDDDAEKANKAVDNELKSMFGIQ